MRAENWKANYEDEIQAAIDARASGNEGKARVCARRAAGILIGVYFDQNQLPPAGSAIKRLEIFRALPGIPEPILEVVDHLLARVDQDHNLPTSIDLIIETRWLFQALKLETENSNSTR